MYTLLLAIIYLAFISLGLPDSLLGSGWPVMRQEFNVPVSFAGIISIIISCGTVLSSLMSDRLNSKFGTRYVTTFSVLTTAIALFGFSNSTAFWMLCFWAIPYGLGAGAIDAALNNYVALHYSAKHMSWLHCFWGVGCIISPYVMSFALTYSSWEYGYRTISILQFAISGVLIFTLPLWKINDHKYKNDNNRVVLGLKNTLKIKGVPSLLLGFFCNSTVESTTILWASSYLVGAKGFSVEKAAGLISLFFIGMTLGRLVAGFITETLGDRKMIQFGAGIAFVGIILIGFPFVPDFICLIGLFVLGLGMAPIYPSIIHSTPSNFGAENSQAIIGIQMSSAYISSTIMPPLFGVLASLLSMHLMPFYLLLFTILMIVMTEKTFSLTLKTK